MLDDVFATLDAERRAALAAVARSAEQTLITAAVLEDVPAELRGTPGRGRRRAPPVGAWTRGPAEVDGERRPAGPAQRHRPGGAGGGPRGLGGPAPARPAAGSPARGGSWTGPGPGADDPQPLGRLVDALVTEQDWTAHTKVGAVFGRWDALVGPDIAAHCRPQSLNEGELLVVAESTAWATQLRLLAPSILGKLRAQVGGDVVTRLRVVGPTAPSWKKGPRTVRGRGPRDTYG